MKLYKTKLKTKQWEILNFLKLNAKGRENGIKGKEIAKHFGIKASTLRYHIKKIKLETETYIGSDREKGYYIPLKSEKQIALQYSERKALSELETRLIQNPQFALKVFKTVHNTLKITDKELHNQVKMKLTGHERETVNKYAK